MMYVAQRGWNCGWGPCLCWCRVPATSGAVASLPSAARAHLAREDLALGMVQAFSPHCVHRALPGPCLWDPCDESEAGAMARSTCDGRTVDALEGQPQEHP